jgi:hypothetical protein
LQACVGVFHGPWCDPPPTLVTSSSPHRARLGPQSSLESHRRP